MIKRRVLFLLVSILSIVDGIRSLNSPYASPSLGFNNPLNPMYIFNSSCLSRTQTFTLQTLQGILARKQPKLFQIGNAMSNTWLQELQDNFNVKINSSVSGNFTEILNIFKSEIKGYVLLSSNISDVLGAVSYISSQNENVIAVHQNDESLMTQIGIVKVADVLKESITPLSILTNSSGNNQFISNRICTLQDPNKFDTGLSDMSVFSRSLHFFDDEGMPSDTSSKVLATLQAGSAVFGWGVGDESKNVVQITKADSFIHASDFAINLASLSGFSIPQFNQKLKVTNNIENKHTICFVLSDGDNLQWLLNSFAEKGQSWFGSLDRGKVPIGFTVSPAMVELAPSVLNYFYKEMIFGMDEFIAGPSGVGYFYPDVLPSQTVISELTGDLMKRADLRIVNSMFYQTDCEANCTYDLLQSDSIDAIFMYSYGGYYAIDGKITWSENGKPIINSRFSFWKGNETPDSLSTKLKNLPKDITSSQSYSLIPVHAWSYSLTDVIHLVEMLGIDGFDVGTVNYLL